MGVGVVVPLDGSQVGVEVEEDRFRKAFLSKFKVGNSEEQEKRTLLTSGSPQRHGGIAT